MAPQSPGQLPAEEGRLATSEQPLPLREATTLPPEAIESIEEPEIVRPVAVEEDRPLAVVLPLPRQVLDRAISTRRPTPRPVVVRRRRPVRRWYIYYLFVCLVAVVLLVTYLLHMPEAR